MKIAIFGAAGDVGTRMMSEALARGHQVTGVVRTDNQLNKLPTEANRCVADITESEQLAHVIQEQDVLISAVRPPDGKEDLLIALTRSLLESTLPGQRVLLVGGAARLLIPGRTGDTVLSVPNFLPAAALEIAKACQAQYELCLAETRTAWTYFSPAAMLVPGERTGCYRLGTDTLVVDNNGESRISMEDFAVAMLDEVETPQHIQKAFTVGY
ncbi:NAD(P)H-binding protein [Halomonas sp. SpR1]|uniref:NAD(P)-dependent oxidoreductase n=1 Tax=Halomonas sp. SpR1 TaxID=3050462 RepID=UPI0027E50E95|nr:NAD(P)H-binding protein [Halomonas sp. SpR1]MDQ7734940.1 NAD(P)H-binding protein [Halomonas sp. SpR1]